MLLDLLDKPGVIWKHKVNSSTFSTKSTSSTNPMDVVFLLLRQLVVYDKSNLLDVNSSSQKVSSDEDSGRPSSEFLHDHVSVHLVHLSVHC